MAKRDFDIRNDFRCRETTYISIEPGRLMLYGHRPEDFQVAINLHMPNSSGWSTAKFIDGPLDFTLHTISHIVG